MHVSSGVRTTSSAEPSRSALAPSLLRVERIDFEMRERLGKSIEYIGKVVRDRDSIELAGLENLRRRLAAGPVSPWVFCLYSRVVTELSKRPPADVAAAFRDVVLAASLRPDQGIIAFRDAGIADSWWDHFQVLHDTDRRRPLRPKAPSPAAYLQCERNISDALAVLKRSDPAFFDELHGLLRMIVLGSPTSAPAFDGVSTFFVWGGTLLNAELSRSAIWMIDLLVHESSHVLLFGLSADAPLTRNSGHERYASPLRSDTRPIDGIFHACFVSTRIHLAMRRLLESGALSAEEASEASARLQHSGNAAGESLAVLEERAELTARGEQIIGELRDYWAAAGLR